MDSDGLRPTAKVKTRMPWIPPGKTSTRVPSFKWEVRSNTEGCPTKHVLDLNRVLSEWVFTAPMAVTQP